MKIPHVTVEWEMLERTVNTKEQAGTDMKKRRENILGAFSPPDLFKIKGRNILLADDILTSGATAEECTKILLAFGAANIDILTLARTMKKI
ncbi:MAG: ComF family protein [Desulfobacteraceae bacterium]|nr:ComF family protein [Desulfobacteraceae bacterium]